jgi:hypothetical protein
MTRPVRRGGGRGRGGDCDCGGDCGGDCGDDDGGGRGPGMLHDDINRRRSEAAPTIARRNGLLAGCFATMATMLLARLEPWHWWIGIILTVATVGSVLGLVGQYLVKVLRAHYLTKRQREQS